MYEMLSTTELTVLQSILYEGAQEAYRFAELKRGDREWALLYSPTRREIAQAFIEAGTELVRRLDKDLLAA